MHRFGLAAFEGHQQRSVLLENLSVQGCKSGDNMKLIWATIAASAILFPLEDQFFDVRLYCLSGGHIYPVMGQGFGPKQASNKDLGKDFLPRSDISVCVSCIAPMSSNYVL